MVKTFDEIAYEIEQIVIDEDMSYDLGIGGNTQESETGGTLSFRGAMYDVIIDIGDNQEYYRLSTSKGGFFNGEDDEKNIKMVKSLKAVKSYLKKFDK